MFQDLRKILAAKADEKAKREETRDRKLKECEETAKQYDDMVIGVLNELITTAYPDSYLQGGRISSDEGNPYYTWEIGHSSTGSGRGGTYTVHTTDIIVNLKFKRNNMPSHFECIAKYRLNIVFVSTLKKKCPLKRDRLAKTLTSLYLRTH
jgi:hypothetical protein